jgi:hypothetical protein
MRGLGIYSRPKMFIARISVSLCDGRERAVTLRVALVKFCHVGQGQLRERYAGKVAAEGQVKKYVASLLDQVYEIQVAKLEEMFFDDVRHFARLAGEAQGSIVERAALWWQVMVDDALLVNGQWRIAEDKFRFPVVAMYGKQAVRAEINADAARVVPEENRAAVRQNDAFRHPASTRHTTFVFIALQMKLTQGYPPFFWGRGESDGRCAGISTAFDSAHSWTQSLR